MKIIDYCIAVSDRNYGDLVSQVNDLIAEGWQPLGGVSMVREPEHEYGNDYEVTRHAQGMVKYEAPALERTK